MKDSKSILRQYQAEQVAKHEQEYGSSYYFFLMSNGKISRWGFESEKKYLPWLRNEMKVSIQYAEKMGTKSLQIMKCSSPKGQLSFNPTPADFEQVEVLEEWGK